MPERLFSPLHVLLLLFLALIIFVLPLLIIFLLVRWLDKWQKRRPRVRVSIAGVVIGGVTDTVSSSILGLPLVFYVMAKFDLLSASGAATAVTSKIHATAWLYGLQLTIGFACSVLGGYIAALIAKHDELLNGLLSAFLCTAMGLYSISAGRDSQSVLVQVLLLAVTPLFALLGGYLRQTQKRVVALSNAS